MSKLKKLISTIGPGILFAGAAVGVSHIMQSTRAGANYGFAFLILVIISNLLKYPFFEYGHRYTAVSGESIIKGYKNLSNSTIWIFFVLNHITGIIASAGVTILTGALFNQLLLNFFGFSLDLTLVCSLVLILSLLVLFIGKYKLLDNLIKGLIVVLSISTLFAVILAFEPSYNYYNDFTELDVFSSNTIIFIIALMGWMPAPIEASAWSSLWALEKNKNLTVKPNLKQALLDFKIGYIGTAVLAIFFLSLGAFVMYSSGETFSDNNIEFTGQLINLYSSSFGDWSKPIISLIALITMVSTTLTVLDAYPRSLEASFNEIKQNDSNKYSLYLILISIIALIIIQFFKTQLKLMIDIATISSFLSAPYFAWINYKLVISYKDDSAMIPSRFMKILSKFGLFFLVSFSLLFLYVFASNIIE